MEENIIEILSNIDKPAMSSIEINDKLGLQTIDDYKKLEHVLDDMTRNGILYYSEKKKRYLLLKNSHLISGKLIVNPKGYGFVVIGDGKKDIYINKDNLNNARNNDTVLIELIGDKTEGKIVKIIDRDENSFVGTVYFNDGKCYVKPDDRGNNDIEILPEFVKGLVEGHKVLVKPIGGNKYVGSVVHVIGHKNDVGVDILSFVYKYGFKPKFPEEVLEELNSIPDDISNEDLSDRVDLRDRVIFTIDGDDTKDIDDAISIMRTDDGYELGVHIADVSHYVKADSAIDKEAYERGTSVYLVDRVIPMLPHQLSNGICSLNPNVDRLAMSCVMNINNHGKVINYGCFPLPMEDKISLSRPRSRKRHGFVREGRREGLTT